MEIGKIPEAPGREGRGFRQRGESSMRNEFLPFTRPAITEADIQAVDAVLRSGWITNGPRNTEFEQRICAITGN